MRYTAVALDFDGTIARDGVVPPHVLDGLARLRGTGRKLLLVTGRELEELLSIFPRVTLFDRVVAENGALLYRPGSGEREQLGDPPPAELVQRLRARGVPLSVGRSIVATVVPHETAVIEAIKELGLERQVIFNKGAVMVLPAGVTKASGLAVALDELALSPRNLVAAGDGENDHALLESAEYSVAVANAIETLKAKADRVTRESHGDGVLEVVADLIESDLGRTPPRAPRRALLLGRDAHGAPFALPGAGGTMVAAGRPRSGKTTLVTGLVERACAMGYQLCVVDTRGHYADFAPALVIGGAERAPDTVEVLTALGKPDIHVVVSLAAVPDRERPPFIADLVRRLAALQESTGRPHWIVVDEARHALPPHGLRDEVAIAPAQNTIYVSAEARRLPPGLLAAANAIVASGEGAGAEIEAIARALDVPAPPEALRDPRAGEALVWSRRSGAAPVLVELARVDRARDREREGVGRLLRRA
ncbi:MAG TPA: HAD family hydrolase [Usitatibacter sp.]|nr:HAD family hydrolase [Usitatibacter sp.]